ncbi:hypothetical protein TRP8649_03950 [Pelagimonas phthalicica]|uniref:DUF2459 domain-containing protein n=1 Tax=Pelagimonas phthalicica TaxID=1037362 RepID=A0A238JGJ3_9RHOB|nr:DUF2459 domain-containing protein [Pelagimonas phthalicica]TDS89643.1 uncharacterized protein (TIGR02117 family) [Pelagimonas phthalicica]SMX29811.1 hypothetical protein TRP8649_03950 [Pelagimonas phthalicica]
MPVLYLFAAGVGAVWPNGQSGGGQGNVIVHLVPGPIHYDFLLPADERTRAVFGFSDAAQHPGARWVVVGWGARGFYTATGDYTDLRADVIWQAATGDQSVMRIDVAGKLPKEVTRRVLHLTEAEYERLLTVIRGEFAEKRPIAGAGLSATDQFFAARGRFHLFRTCNVWVAEVMAQAGLRFGRWTPAPFAVTLSAWIFQG